MATKLSIVKPESVAEKTTRTTVDTVEFTPEIVRKWVTPPFQRPLRINDKVRALALEIAANRGVIPGVLTLGILDGVTYRLDGQHRIEAFLLSEEKVGYADVRTLFCKNMAEMGEEFVKLNSQLVRMRPDDILRGLEHSNEALRYIRGKCRFVGYDMIRRNETSPLLSMSAALRCWEGSKTDVPKSPSSSASNLAVTMTLEDAEQAVGFFGICYDAWGRDVEYGRMWGSLNSILCAWLYRRTVITQYSNKTPRLTKDLFKKCLMSLSADEHYSDWLVGRKLSERDRSPAYDKLKKIFVVRLSQEMGTKPKLPAPAWALS